MRDACVRLVLLSACHSGAAGRALHLEAFEAGVRAVRTDRQFGDEAPPPTNFWSLPMPR